MKKKARQFVKITAPAVDLGLMQKNVIESLKKLKAAERADQRASYALFEARGTHMRALSALRNGLASVEGANK